jgi:hypothetical protein
MNFLKRFCGISTSPPTYPSFTNPDERYQKALTKACKPFKDIHIGPYFDKDTRFPVAVYYTTKTTLAQPEFQKVMDKFNVPKEAIFRLKPSPL